MAGGKNAKSFYFGSSPKRSRRDAAPKGSSNSYEKGIITDAHGVPFVKPDGKPLRQKDLNDGGSEMKEKMSRARTSKFL
tara:strand:+ start:1016 stop:1252 length:237 start_codon:yes stop_codon:yes gene_type:complete